MTAQLAIIAALACYLLADALAKMKLIEGKLAQIGQVLAIAQGGLCGWALWRIAQALL